jgi:DNA-binding CsgD family transcriptional regulator
MRKPARRNVLGDLTDRELKIIELRTSGIKPGEIARRTSVSRQAVYAVISRIYRKAGVDNTALLTSWAVGNALDEPLAPERSEDIPKPEPKVHREPIKLGRIRRSKLA